MKTNKILLMFFLVILGIQCKAQTPVIKIEDFDGNYITQLSDVFHLKRSQMSPDFAKCFYG